MSRRRCISAFVGVLMMPTAALLFGDETLPFHAAMTAVAVCPTAEQPLLIVGLALRPRWPRVNFHGVLPRLGLDGFCPVKLVEQNSWQHGQPLCCTMHRGYLYRFTGKAERDRFRANPEKYVPIASGHDVVLAKEEGIAAPGKREFGGRYSDRIYLFAREASRKTFFARPKEYAAWAQLQDICLLPRTATTEAPRYRHEPRPVKVEMSPTYGFAGIENPKLKLNLYATWGPFGSLRPPKIKVIPGERLDVQVMISGLGLEKDGKVDCLMEAELLDPKGNRLVRLPEMTVARRLPFGHTCYVNTIYFDFSRDNPAGEHRIRVRLADRVKKESTVEEFPCEVLPQTLGAVAFRLSSDEFGISPCDANLTVGQAAYVYCCYAGFASNSGKGHLKSVLRILDDQNRPLSPEPITCESDNLPPTDSGPIPIVYQFTADRAGKFTLRVEVEDCIGRKTATYDMPVVVSPPPALAP